MQLIFLALYQVQNGLISYKSFAEDNIPTLLWKFPKSKSKSISIFQKRDDYYDRRNPRHPEVGRARPPDLNNVRSKVSTKNNNFHRRREPNKVKIFNDRDYMKAVKVNIMRTFQWRPNDKLCLVVM